MKIIQHKDDGSGKIVFSEEEIKIIEKAKGELACQEEVA